MQLPESGYDSRDEASKGVRLCVQLAWSYDYGNGHKVHSFNCVPTLATTSFTNSYYNAHVGGSLSHFRNDYLYLTDSFSKNAGLIDNSIPSIPIASNDVSLIIGMDHSCAVPTEGIAGQKVETKSFSDISNLQFATSSYDELYAFNCMAENSDNYHCRIVPSGIAGVEATYFVVTDKLGMPYLDDRFKPRFSIDRMSSPTSYMKWDETAHGINGKNALLIHDGSSGNFLVGCIDAIATFNLAEFPPRDLIGYHPTPDSDFFSKIGSGGLYAYQPNLENASNKPVPPQDYINTQKQLKNIYDDIRNFAANNCDKINLIKEYNAGKFRVGLFAVNVKGTDIIRNGVVFPININEVGTDSSRVTNFTQFVKMNQLLEKWIGHKLFPSYGLPFDANVLACSPGYKKRLQKGIDVLQGVGGAPIARFFEFCFQLDDYITFYKSHSTKAVNTCLWKQFSSEPTAGVGMPTTYRYKLVSNEEHSLLNPFQLVQDFYNGEEFAGGFKLMPNSYHDFFIYSDRGFSLQLAEHSDWGNGQFLTIRFNYPKVQSYSVGLTDCVSNQRTKLALVSDEEHVIFICFSTGDRDEQSILFNYALRFPIKQSFIREHLIESAKHLHLLVGVGNGDQKILPIASKQRYAIKPTEEYDNILGHFTSKITIDKTRFFKVSENDVVVDDDGKVVPGLNQTDANNSIIAAAILADNNAPNYEIPHHTSIGDTPLTKEELDEIQKFGLIYVEGDPTNKVDIIASSRDTQTNDSIVPDDSDNDSGDSTDGSTGSGESNQGTNELSSTNTLTGKLVIVLSLIILLLTFFL